MVKPGSPLCLERAELAASQEWSREWEGWHLVRVSAGAAYWLGRDNPRALNPGDAVLVRPGAHGCLRASYLGSATLAWFQVNPALLTGVLSVVESHFLTEVAPRIHSDATIFPAGDPVAQEYAGICALASSTASLVLRTRMLALVAAIFGKAWPREPADSELKTNDATRRFQRLIHELVEGEILNCSPADLARRCGCSPRHFSRLFRQHVGTSVRARQTELRLQKARELLRTSSAKIIEVAFESGYQHLGLFNLMFKRRFGLTPTEWRRMTQKRPVIRPLLAALSLVGVTWLGTVFSLGAQSAQPPPPASTHLYFQVSRYVVEGNTLLSQAILARTLNPFTGPAMAVEQVGQARAELQLAYRTRGYATVVVTLPPQRITNGVVRLQVTEGRLAQIRVTGNHYFSSNNVVRALPSLRTNLILNSHVFQAELDRANANRDRQIYPLLGPGPAPGTSALDLQVKDRLPLHGRLELNNESTPGTPYWRINGSLQYNNLWQEDHSAGVQYAFSPVDFKHVPLPARFYDSPLIAYYSAYYRLPIGPPESVAEQVAAAPASFGYDEVTRQFRLPPPTGRPELTWFASRATIDTGPQYSPEHLVTQTATTSIISQDSGEDLTDAADVGVRFSQPLNRLTKIRSSFSLGLDFKTFHLTSFNTNNFYIRSEIPDPRGPGFPPIIRQDNTASPQPVRNATVQYLPLNYRLDFSLPDPYGTTAFGVSHSLNLAGLFSGRPDFASLTGAGSSSGTYQLVYGELTRSQRIYGDWSVNMSANGQWASEPLISNEQFGMGGHAGVRGYLEGEQYGDLGWRALFEPQTPPLSLGMITPGKTMWIRGSIFTDYGQSYSLAGNTHVNMWGAGFGFTSNIGNNLDLRLTAAWPILTTFHSKAGQGIVYFGVGAQF